MKKIHWKCYVFFKIFFCSFFFLLLHQNMILFSSPGELLQILECLSEIDLKMQKNSITFLGYGLFITHSNFAPKTKHYLAAKILGSGECDIVNWWCPLLLLPLPLSSLSSPLSYTGGSWSAWSLCFKVVMYLWQNVSHNSWTLRNSIRWNRKIWRAMIICKKNSYHNFKYKRI